MLQSLNRSSEELSCPRFEQEYLVWWDFVEDRSQGGAILSVEEKLPPEALGLFANVIFLTGRISISRRGGQRDQGVRADQILTCR